MDNQTFRSRLVELMQRSRRAMRAYASVGRSHPGFASINDASGNQRDSLEFTELQAEEWRQVNAELLKQLGVALDQPNPRSLIPSVLVVYDRLVNELQLSESEVRARQIELLRAAESGDFVKAAVLSKRLVILKARLQATRAAESELEQIVGRLHNQMPDAGGSPLTGGSVSSGSSGTKSSLLNEHPEVKPTIELQTSVDDVPLISSAPPRAVPLVHEILPELGKQVGAAGGAHAFGNSSGGPEIGELETRPLAKVIRLHKR